MLTAHSRLRVSAIIPDFKAMLSLADGSVLGFRKTQFLKYKPPFDEHERFAVIPATLANQAGAFSKLSARLLRSLPYRMALTPKGTLVATSVDGILRLQEGEKRFQRVFNDYQGRRPISLCVDGNGVIYFGEYFKNADRRPVRIFSSRNEGEDWAVCHTFEAGEIRHVHGLEYDSHSGFIWTYTGDEDNESHIALAGSNFESYEVVLSLGQQSRVCSGIQRPEGLYYGTDTPREQNYLYFLPRNGALRKLVPVQQSVFHSASACGGMFFSTVVEPSELLTTQSVHVWYSQDGENWENALSLPGDNYSRKLFQFPSVSFAKSTEASRPWAFLNLSATKRFDQSCVVLELKDSR